MKRSKTNQQNGIALISALFILLLLSAVAASLVLMTNTETGVNANYRGERTLDFAARAGIEEVRDRMMTSNAAPLTLPTSLPSSANNSILYVLGGPTPASVAPWTAGTIYTDDELCHDGYGIVAAQSSDVHCSAVPAGTGWYATATSNAPWAATTAALPYVWVRVALKENGSIENYPVDSATCATTGAAGCSTAVCYNGTNEVLLTAATCGAMATPASPVYLLTALAVNPISGARKIIQADVALPPPTVVTNNTAGFFATSTACGAFTMTGNASTGSYSSTSGNPPFTISTTTGGNIGTNGNVSLTGNVNIGGDIQAPNTTVGACPDGATETGNITVAATPKLVANPAGGVTEPTPPLPNPLPPTTNTSYTGNTSTSLVPGNYGNLSFTGNATLTLAPGVYNINSLQLTGNGTIQISPAGAVVINIAGQGFTGSAQPLNLTGNDAIDNTSAVATNFKINYPGTQPITVTGNSNAYAIVNAPNSPISLTGNSSFYGSMIGSTITDTGNASMYFDSALSSGTTVTPSTLSYQELGMREVAY